MSFRQTLLSICVGKGSEELLDSEVERFLRSRLVMCRLTDVMTPDITKYDSESDSEEEDGVEGHGIFNVTATTRGEQQASRAFGFLFHML